MRSCSRSVLYEECKGSPFKQSTNWFYIFLLQELSEVSDFIKPSSVEIMQRRESSFWTCTRISERETKASSAAARFTTLLTDEPLWIKSLSLNIKMETAAKQGVALVIFERFYFRPIQLHSSSDSHLCGIHQVLGCRQLYKPLCKPFCKCAWLKDRPHCVYHVFKSLETSDDGEGFRIFRVCFSDQSQAKCKQ